jgi:hypothetical protein
MIGLANRGDSTDPTRQHVAHESREGSMDREQFDAIARLFATRRTRRLALAALAGAALFNHTLAEGVAKKNKHKRRRRKRAGSAGGLCTPLENLCYGPLTRDCCPNTQCVKPIPTQKVPIPGACQSGACTDDAACTARFPNQDVYCEKDSSKCEGLLRGSCCRPKRCDQNSDCPHSSLCCPFLGVGQCCVQGQICTFTGCYGGISK